MKDKSGKKNDEVCSGFKGVGPKFEGYRGLERQGKPNFDNVAMFTFDKPILLVSVGT